MQKAFTPAEIAACAASLARLFDHVQLADAALGTVLDPATLAPCPDTPLLLPAPASLCAGECAWLPAPCPDGSGSVQLVLCHGVTVAERALVLSIGFTLPSPAPEDPRAGDAVHRALTLACEELYQDYLTGTHNRLYLEEVYRRTAPREGLSVAVVRVPEYAALTDTTAGDRCLNAAAGVLRTALDPAWPAGVLARVAEDVFVLAAVCTPQTLDAALHAAHDGARRQFGLSLSQRGHFTLRWLVAPGTEAVLWTTLPRPQ